MQHTETLASQWMVEFTAIYPPIAKAMDISFDVRDLDGGLSAEQNSDRLAEMQTRSTDRLRAFRLLLRYLYINSIDLGEAHEVTKKLIQMPSREAVPDKDTKYILEKEQTHRSSYKSEMVVVNGKARRYTKEQAKEMYHREMTTIKTAQQKLEISTEYQRVRAMVVTAIETPVTDTVDVDPNVLVANRIEQYKDCYLSILGYTDTFWKDLRKALRLYYQQLDTNASSEFLRIWHHELDQNLKAWRHKQTASGALNTKFAQIRADALSRGYPFDLTPDDYAKLVKNKECHYCGEQFVGVKPWGLDRLNNLLGYSTCNVRLCCGVCNRMKSNKTLSEFFIVIAWIAYNKGLHSTRPPVSRITFEPKTSAKFAMYAANAKYRGLECHLTEEQYNALRESPCSYCGRDGPVGIDRTNTNEGYSTGNSIPACWPCNETKSNVDYDVFLQKCQLIAQRHPVSELRLLSQPDKFLGRTRVPTHRTPSKRVRVRNPEVAREAEKRYTKNNPLKRRLSNKKSDAINRRNPVPWNLTGEEAMAIISGPCHHCGAHVPSKQTILRVNRNYGWVAGNVLSNCGSCPAIPKTK